MTSKRLIRLGTFASIVHVGCSLQPGEEDWFGGEVFHIALHMKSIEHSGVYGCCHAWDGQTHLCWACAPLESGIGK
jgi:hypothetical protein